MSLPAILGGTAVSLAGIGYLAATDPKRRRVFRLPQPGERRHAGAAAAAILMPGLVVPVWSGAAGFVIWFGAISVAGWAMAATSPERSVAAQRWIGDRARSIGSRLPSMAPIGTAVGRMWRGATAGVLGGAGPRHVRDLERRVLRLEAEMADMRRILVRQDDARDDSDGDVVVELVRPGRR